MISSLVLKRKPEDIELILNSTKHYNNCGINDCPGISSGESAYPPDMKTVNIKQFIIDK